MEWYVGRSGTALMQNWGRRITQLHPMMLCELDLSASVVGMIVFAPLPYSVSCLATLGCSYSDAVVDDL